ncbi:hypothetical protein [Bacillus sp. 1P02SD]|uniref:hypothetical protein n=1 Tax=Bacillus sp. 1P02SD TaxID=3132264 RepID=UPI0039A14AAA
MGSMYAWATPDHLLNNMSIEQILMYYDYGIEHETNKANILVNRIAVGLFGVEDKNPKKRDYNDSPDKEAFYKHYGDRIKRPEVKEV